MVEHVYPWIEKRVRGRNEEICEAANQERAVTDKIFLPGQLVMVAREDRPNKQSAFKAGPYFVMKYDEERKAYEVRERDGRKREKDVRHEDMSVFKGTPEEHPQHQYPVTRITDTRMREGKLEYQVKRKGCLEKEWESADNLDPILDSKPVENFWKTRRKNLRAPSTRENPPSSAMRNMHLGVGGQGLRESQPNQTFTWHINEEI
eukprot:CAMPEP_0201534580 /NCGR_PEP_ID=MMETSP0161_2-20130828/56705_1 /ASSEMBLY_ACC=CAM_ASM_000251 /TAXON_ID=180227 /ORGANISM="Neoparamoeba aestuarina, Strain SoJaBio B1-5/56/2" /LENGTH=204 /DNA_ID=CAMNT_0047939303 /DNA_START=27 /DNA_END=641 /DNA_ORIENTATION=-